MDENWDEEEELESESKFKLPQYSLRTLMIVVTGAAVLCSLIAWLGYVVVFIFAGALGIFLGLLLCTYAGLGFAFENLPWDVAKCFIVACATIAPLYILPYFFHVLDIFPFFAGPIYVFAPPFFYWVSMKTAWNDIGLLEIFITAVVSFFTWAFVSYVVAMVVALIFHR